MTHSSTLGLGPSDSLVLAWTPRREKLYKRYEAEANAMMDAAPEFGHKRRPPLVWPGRNVTQADADRWWIEVLGDTERDLEAYRASLARRYRKLLLRPWRHRQRREVLELYIRVETMLTRAHGLSIGWR